MGRTRLVTFVMMFCAMGRAHADGELPQDLTIRAAAPLALADADLGRPVSSRFEPIIGKEGKTLFPSAKTRSISVNSWLYDFQSIDTSHELNANAHAWMVDLSMTTGSDTRYVVYRAIQITSAVELDDTEEPRQAGPDASYYVRKIYFGRVYEQVYSGSSDVFTTDVRAELFTAGGAIDFQKRHREIEWKVFARGLSPKSAAIFARTPQAIQEAYTEDKAYNAGKPVPVLVEYRRIPGARLDNFNEIEWKKPNPLAAQLKVRMLQIDGRKSQWTDTGITLAENDVLIGEASGKVTVGPIMGTMEPNTSGVGRLEVSIDGNISAPGKKWLSGHTAGPVRLRVYDSEYDDNSGSYSVTLVVVPAAAFRSSDCARLEAAGPAPCR